MIKKAYLVMNNIKTGGYCRTQNSSSHLSHLYKRICPKMHEDASLAAGPCSITSAIKRQDRIHGHKSLLEGQNAKVSRTDGRTYRRTLPLIESLRLDYKR